MADFQHIKETFLDISKRNNFSPKYSKIFNVSPQNGFPHIEVKDDDILFIIEERGCLLSKKKASSVDEVLYWMFSMVTFDMACDYELKNRDKSSDSRKIIFSKQLEILGKISENWRERRQKEIQDL
ncbi:MULTISPECIES: Imm63 family immunity protein [Thalassospira]|uniref:Imm63 family immunity protein n=1 Tax=Thalassospira TaxID=168934 RepID=UPI000A1F91CE|nr:MULTISPECIES: Imm63 family immunity protein [Thalassospira]